MKIPTFSPPVPLEVGVVQGNMCMLFEQSCCACVQVGVLAEWVNPLYLDVGVGIHIREQFEEESQVKLEDFLLVSSHDTRTHVSWCIRAAPVVCSGGQVQGSVRGPGGGRHQMELHWPSQQEVCNMTVTW